MPPLAYVVTKRICLGLQRRDRDLVLHGRETGRIVRLPHGEMIEVHEPISEARKWELTQHLVRTPYQVGPVDRRQRRAPAQADVRQGPGPGRPGSTSRTGSSRPPPPRSTSWSPATITDAPATGPLCLVTGATGYIGGRLVPELLAAGHRVRVMARRPESLRDHPWAGHVEVVAADAADEESLRRAMAGVDVAYYLIHALGTAGFERDRPGERASASAGRPRRRACGRLVYLGGLAPDVPAEELSPHLRSRVEVGDVLLDSGVPTAVLRAAVIIGSGSASFEMLRYLTERLPAMITPRWVDTRIQPIAIRDVLRYLVGAAGLPAEVSPRPSTSAARTC